MSERAKQLAGELNQFKRRVIEFVEGCDPKDWSRELDWEQWPVGVTARHLGAGHFQLIEIIDNLLKGEGWPPLTQEVLVQMGNQHAAEHAECSREEVLGILRENGEALSAYVAGLTDAELDRAAKLAMTDSEVSVYQLISLVVLQSGGEHLANMQKAVAAA